jgi:acetyltransferase-like isoleucine patch superfamily enzyme
LINNRKPDEVNLMRNLTKLIQNKLIENKKLRFIASRLYFKINRNKVRFRGKNNEIIKDGSFIKKINVQVHGNNNKIIFRDLSRVSNLKIYIEGNDCEILIDESCLFNSGEIWIQDDRNRLSIGKKTRIVNAYFAIMEPMKSIIIGRECMLSYGIQFRCSDSHSILENTTKRRINYAKDIYVGDKVWIGTDVIILKGVTIGSSSVIGMKTLVTKNIQPYSLAVGIPAKVVRDNITWDWRRLYGY